jgi:DNA replication initiation complex subunit (GINS family)
MSNDKNKPKVGLDRFKSFTINIVDSRLSKMLRLARSELSVDDELKLTNSEKLLYKKLSKLIKVWRAFFLSFK